MYPVCLPALQIIKHDDTAKVGAVTVNAKSVRNIVGVHKRNPDLLGLASL